jgi:hypothetical protein
LSLPALLLGYHPAGNRLAHLGNGVKDPAADRFKAVGRWQRVDQTSYDRAAATRLRAKMTTMLLR